MQPTEGDQETKQDPKQRPLLDAVGKLGPSKGSVDNSGSVGGHSDDQDDWSRVEAPSEVYSASASASASGSPQESDGEANAATRPPVPPESLKQATTHQPQHRRRESQLGSRSARTVGASNPEAHSLQQKRSLPGPSKLARQTSEIEPSEQLVDSLAGQALRQEQPAKVWGGGSSWGGWDAWGLTNSLRSAAAEAAKDVREFTTSFQQTLAAEEDDDDVAASRGSPSSRPVQSRGAPQVNSNPDNLTPEALARRQAVIDRLQGRDTSLEVGLKAFDNQVEQLAHGVGQTLGGIFGGARGIWQSGVTNAQKVMDEVSHHVRDTDSSAADRGVHPGASAAQQSTGSLLAGSTRRVGAMLAAHAESSFEELSRQARGLLQGEHSGPTAGLPRQAAVGAFATESPAEETFDHSFYVFGGLQAYEELEALGNDCARQLNRLRSRIPAPDKAALDALTSALGPAFDIGADWEGDEEAAAEADESANPVAKGHAVIADLCGEGIGHAEELLSQAKQAGPPAAASSDPALNSSQSSQGADLVAHLRAEGSRALAEAASLCLERLLALSRSLAATLRYSKPADDGIHWPSDARRVVGMLRAQAKRMLEDLEALGQAYVDAVSEVAREVASPRGEGQGSQKVADIHAGDLETDCGAAAGRLQEAFRALLYIVLLSAQDRSLLKGPG